MLQAVQEEDLLVALADAVQAAKEINDGDGVRTRQSFTIPWVPLMLGVDAEADESDRKLAQRAFASTEAAFVKGRGLEAMTQLLKRRRAAMNPAVSAWDGAAASKAALCIMSWFRLSVRCVAC